MEPGVNKTNLKRLFIRKRGQQVYLSYMGCHFDSPTYKGIDMNLSFNVADQSSTNFPLGKSKYQVRLLEKFADKDKWVKRFFRAYKGPMQHSMTMYTDISKFLVISRDGIEMGYARISNYSLMFEEVYRGEVWSISEIFVKEEFRGQGVMTSFIEYLVKFQNVKSIYLNKAKFFKSQKYYDDIGFGECLVLNDKDHYMVYLVDFKGVIDELCKSKRYGRVNLDISRAH